MASHLSFSLPQYLGQVFLVVDHLPDVDVRYKIREAEDLFGRIVTGEAKSTNIPADAPPELPRLEIRDGRKHLILAQSRIQLSLTFDKNLGIDRAYEVVKKNAQEFYAAAQKFQPLDQKTQIGLVIQINQPVDQSKLALSEFLATHLYKPEITAKFATFELKIGLLDDTGLYRNFAFSVYENRKLKLPPNPSPGTLIKIDMSTTSVSEIGIRSTLDINNKAKVDLGTPEELSSDSDISVTVSQVIAGMDEMFRSQRHKIIPIQPS